MDVLRPTEAEALGEWARRVRANREQAERVREAPERPDFYAPVAASFKADPRRTDEEALNLLLSLVEPGERWLDIGAGGGRYALPLALAAREVVALDPSEGMLTVLREGMAENEIGNVRVVQSRWPSTEKMSADACLISHIGYDIEEIGPFLEAMEASASRLCVAILLARSPAFVAGEVSTAFLSEGLAALRAKSADSQGVNSPPAKLVAITFDDGFRDFYTEAFPILQRERFSATMFLPTSFIAEQPRQFLSRDCMTWSEVRELSCWRSEMSTSVSASATFFHGDIHSFQ